MKQRKRLSKALSAILCVMMIVSAVPLSAFAASSAQFTQSQLSVVADKQSTLAPGVTQDAYTVYDKNGDQVKMFVTTADMSVDTVKLFTSYRNMDPTDFGMSKLTEQVAAFDKKAAAGDPYYQGTVVAGINASYYNMTTGQPSGIFVMNGVVGNASESAGYFAVMKDGSVKIGVKGDYAKDAGNIQEALGIYTMLIVDGEICSGLDDKQKYPRQTIGITADGNVITMTADGSQAPTSIGLTVKEQAQVMLDLGCVWAGHLDGGGSCTYGAKAEGSNEFVITNNPSDGAERSISNGFFIVSTAVSDGIFKSASLTAEYDYITPGSIVNVSAVGSDKAGGPAEIPADVSWQLADSTIGTIENGVFTSNGTTGDAVVQMVYGGNVVGETTIHVVVPDAITFDQAEMVVPFGKTVEIGLTATVDNGLHVVTLKASDVRITFDHDIGTMNGFAFTAAENPEVISAVCTVTVLGTDVSASANITLGKGSEVISDFNDGEMGIWQTQQTLNFNYYFPGNNISVENGALRLEFDYSNSLESGYMCTGLGTRETYVIENGLALGFWIFVPEESEGLRLRMCIYDENNVRKTAEMLPIGKVSTLEKGAWYYVKADISSYPTVKILKDKSWLEFYIQDRDDLDHYGYNHLNYDSLNTKLVFYIDDITVDYSAAVEDREAPVFTNPTYAYEGTSDAVVLANGVTISGATIDFAVNVSDYSANNAVGLDATSAKVYVDGNEVSATYKNGMITVNCALSDGRHHIKFEMADKNGNTAILTRSFTVNTGSNNEPVKLVAHDASLQNVLFGSIYYVDLVATEIENVQSITVALDLNNMNKWELDHMEVLGGFEATYEISEDTNVATLTITRTGDVALTGEAALVSMPVRVFELPIKPSDSVGASKPVGSVFTYAFFKKVGSKGESWPISVTIEVDKGLVTYTDGTSDFFSGEDVKVMTESQWWHNDATTGADYLAWNGGHDHRAETKQYYAASLTNHVDAVALANKAPTCTEAGYTGRTFCEVCNSVVDWGTTIPATGHSYEVVDGVLKCTCGELFNGVWTDGKTYVDGIVVADGWVGNSYFAGGVKLTGVQKVTAPDASGEYYYDFGENGICEGQRTYTGLFYDTADKVYRFSKLGVLTGGWQQIGENWHCFNSKTLAAYTGECTPYKATFQFDETGMTKGAWYTDGNGTRYYYGPSFYKATNPGYMKLVEIDGVTYNFDSDGNLTTGKLVLQDAASYNKYAFIFAEDGSLIEKVTAEGFFTDSDGNKYYINSDGIILKDQRLICYDNSFYYVDVAGKLILNNCVRITDSNNNGICIDGTNPAIGNYYFDEDGKLDAATGVRQCADGYFYYCGSHSTEKSGLVEVDGSIYYVKPSGKVAVNETRIIYNSTSNGLVPAGTYDFGADGKLILFTGVKAGADGNLYYYKDSAVVTGTRGLVKVGEDIYYVKPSGKVAVNETRDIYNSTSNGLVPAGTYDFGADGKLIFFTGVKKGTDGNLYYYENSAIVTGTSGLVKVGEDIYYVKPSGKVAVNETRIIYNSTSNGLVPAGTYDFSADGKLIRFTGVKAGADGNLYYYRDGVLVTGTSGLVKVGTDIYYVKPSGKVAVNETRDIYNSTSNGLVPAGSYDFGVDGKMITE